MKDYISCIGETEESAVLLSMYYFLKMGWDIWDCPTVVL